MPTLSNKVNRKVFVNLKDKIKTFKSLTVSAGFPKDSSETNSVNEGVTALDKATRNNFGIGVPERPFMDIAYATNKSKYRKLILKALSKIDILNQTQFLNKLGVEAVNDIQDTIVSLKSPANADSTIALKGSSNPLIDSGHMRQSVTYQIKKVG